MAAKIGEGANDAGMKRENILSYKDKRDLVEGLFKVVEEGDTVLVKGSRGMRLEDVSKALEDRE